MPPEMQAELDKVVSALRDFYARESQLFEKDLGERTFAHRLAVHVEKQFGGWDVDCDYNRLGERTVAVAGNDFHAARPDRGIIGPAQLRPWDFLATPPGSVHEAAPRPQPAPTRRSHPVHAVPPPPG